MVAFSLSADRRWSSGRNAFFCMLMSLFADFPVLYEVDPVSQRPQGCSAEIRQTDGCLQFYNV